MFSFFKKYGNNDIIKNHLSAFKGSFTDEQKKAILVSLFVIANSDKEFHIKEVEFLQQTADLLEYQFSDNINEEFSGINRGEVFKQLKDFSEDQKEWYLVTVAGMISEDKEISDIELDDALRYLLSMGISNEKINKTLDKLKSVK